MANDSRDEVQRFMVVLDGRGSQVGVRPAFVAYLSQLWGRRNFIWMDARHRVATQNSRNRLGNVWLLLRPVLDAAMYYVIFALILNTDRGIERFPAFLIIGGLMFRSTRRGGAGW